MYIEGSPEYEHHIKTYGKHKEFGYKEFIPHFDGAKFCAGEWLDVFEKAGAKYIVPVAEHHDGFALYDTELSEYNSVKMGPKRDVVGELFTEAKKRGVVAGASNHRIEHWWFFGNGKKFDSDVCEPLKRGDFYWPSMDEPKCHFDIFDASPSREFLEDWLVRNCEFIDRYKPRMLYFDWWIQTAAAAPYLKKLAAYYYNKGLEWGTPVVINYKHEAFPYGTAVLDLERSKYDIAQPDFWQSCTSIAKNSWCYTKGNIYKTSEEIICELVDIVSKNGCLLLNVGPKADGIIPDEEKKVLKEIGDWMRINGEAIYGSKYFRICGEGTAGSVSSKKQTDGQTSDAGAEVYTSADIRYTQKGTRIYAIVLKCAKDGVYRLKSFARKNGGHNTVINAIRHLGGGAVTFEHNADELVIKAKGIKSDMPLVFEIV